MHSRDFCFAIGLASAALLAACDGDSTPTGSPTSSAAGGGAGGTSTGGQGGTGATPTTNPTGGDGGTAGTAGTAGQGGIPTGGQGGTGGASCADPATDCPPPSGPCVQAGCVAGSCVESPLPAGSPLLDSAPGDCQSPVCDGAGAESLLPEPLDLPDDGKECTADSCDGPTPLFTPEPPKTPCAGGAMLCNSEGDCVECVDGADCPSAVCLAFSCAPAACDDGVKNGAESDIDCGGPDCPTCPDGSPCTEPADCQSALCHMGVCCSVSPAECDGKCGVVSACGTEVDCGGCAPPAVCGAQVANQCYCAPPCPIWTKRFGDPGVQIARGLGVDPAGNVLVTGYFSGNVDFGGGVVTGTDTDIFAVRLDPTGAHLYSHAWGTPTWGQLSFTAATDATGNLIFGGEMSSTVDFGGGPLSSVTPAALLVKLTPAGAHVYSRAWSGFGQNGTWGVKATTAGEVIATGYFQTTVDFGGGPLTSAGFPDVFVTKLGPTGAHVYSKRFGGPDTDWARAVDLDTEDRPIIAGHFRQSMPVGATTLTSGGGDDIFVFKLDVQGNPLWAHRYGASGEDRAHGLAARPDGGFVMTGYIQGTVSLGGPALTTPAGTRGMFVAAYDAQGDHLWSKRIGTTGTLNYDFPAVGVDLQGNVLLTGACTGSLDFGAGPVPCPASESLFIAKLTPTGQLLWHKEGTGTKQYGYGIAADSQGNVIVTGHFQGTLDLGLGPMISAGDRDIFVAKLAP
ncbi:MAG: SBBP repeat-containing protein [Polyangiaceae bacterium]